MFTISFHFYYCEHAKAHHHQCGTQLFAPRFHTLSSFDLEARPKLHRLSLYIYCYVPHYFDSIISGSNLVCLFTKEAKQLCNNGLQTSDFVTKKEEARSIPCLAVDRHFDGKEAKQNALGGIQTRYLLIIILM